MCRFITFVYRMSDVYTKAVIFIKHRIKLATKIYNKVSIYSRILTDRFMETGTSAFEQTHDIAPTAPQALVAFAGGGQPYYLLLGFFSRGNVGDEAFVKPYSILFPEKHLVYQCIDDVICIPNEVEAVIVAGGDVINDYFMLKLKDLLVSFHGPCYAFSVGISYLSEKKHTELFDHVVLRSKQDLNEVAENVGVRNVSYLPDVSWLLQSRQSGKSSQSGRTRHTRTHQHHHPKQLKFGICLAQPYFAENPYKSSLETSVVQFIKGLIEAYPDCEVNLIAFNTSTYELESELIINNQIHAKLSGYLNVHNICDSKLQNPEHMLSFIGQHDMIIGMRYHAILFSMMEKVPFIALYTTRKIGNLLKDHGMSKYGMELHNSYETSYMPVTFDNQSAISLVAERLSHALPNVEVELNVFNFLREMVTKKKRREIIVRTFLNLTYEETMDKCKSMIQTYLGVDSETFERWNEGKLRTSSLLEISKKECLDFARLICFGITNKIGTPYVWGLKDNMIAHDFTVKEAIRWIYDDFAANLEQELVDHAFHPPTNVSKKVIIDLNYMCQDNYQGLHRSGWSYVIGGLQNLDSHNLARPAKILVDTCLERTFLWGLDVTKTSKIVPYTTPWVGFIHHTFDTSYSKYNCETLINTKEFQVSLQHCKCLFTLSQHLKQLILEGLEAIGIKDVNVLNLIHPTEIVDNQFTMGKFLANHDRKIVNVGAWLRDPYAIHSLPIPENNRINIRKCSLKGKEMDNYFVPSWLFSKMSDFLVDYSNEDNHHHGLSRSNTSKNTAPASSNPSCGTSRPHNVMCRPIRNKYLEGMLNQLRKDEASVSVLENITNDNYDDLLSQNIVFLSFTSAPSASNTVVECIVRNTPLIVNRFPALEEVLGIDYPGFYPSGNLFQAASMIIDLNHIFVIHEYLKAMNKSKFTLDYFLEDFQNKLLCFL